MRTRHPDPADTAPAASPDSHSGRAVLLMILAIGLLACMDGMLKALSAHYPAIQVSALRGLSSLPFAFAWALWRIGARGLLRVRWSLQLLRGVLGVGMMVGFISALAAMPLSTVYAAFFVAPLIVTLLAIPLLGERIGPRRWTAIAMGLAGVLLVLRPDAVGLSLWGGLAVLGSAFCYALSAVLVRILGRTDATPSMVFWMLAVMGTVAAVLAAPAWRPIDTAHWPLIAGVGVLGMLGQVAITEAFRQGEASVVAPFEYTALLYSVAMDAMIWGVLPDRLTWAGAGVIVASGLYLLRRERVHAEAEKP